MNCQKKLVFRDLEAIKWELNMQNCAVELIRNLLKVRTNQRLFGIVFL
jgi:hypothetical protein